MSFSELRKKIESDAPPIALLFSAGFGVVPEILKRVDLALAALRGPGDYNDLSMRAAAAVILDRL